MQKPRRGGERAPAALANLEKGRRPVEVERGQAPSSRRHSRRRTRARPISHARASSSPIVSCRPRSSTPRIARRDSDRARVVELSAQVNIANLPARSDEIAAARAEVRAAGDALAQAQWRLDQKSAGRTGRRACRRHTLRAGGVRRRGGSGRLAAPARQRQGPLLRARAGGRDGPARSRGDSALRRLRGADRRARRFRRAASRVHAAGHLQPREPREARVPGRGAADAAERPAQARAAGGSRARGDQR